MELGPKGSLLKLVYVVPPAPLSITPTVPVPPLAAAKLLVIPGPVQAPLARADLTAAMTEASGVEWTTRELLKRSSLPFSMIDRLKRTSTLSPGGKEAEDEPERL